MVPPLQTAGISRDEIWAKRLQEGYHAYSTGATKFGTTHMNVAIRPLVQLNLMEKFLNPVANAVPMMTKEQRRAKVERIILPRHDVACMKHKPKNGPT